MRLLAVTILSGLLLVLSPSCTSVPPADVIFTGGTIHTLDPEHPRATALVATDGVLIYVGDEDGAHAYRGPHTRVVELDGATVVPGFNDAHMHLSGVGYREMNLNLEGTESLSDLLGRVEQRIAESKRGQWIVGRGWIETFWDPPRFPTRWDLDTISPDHPVWLTRVDGHGAVANSLALKIAGIDRNTESPFGGEILKDADSGEPTGMLLDNAQGLVNRRIPPNPTSALDRALVLGAEVSAKRGWTGVQVAGTSWREMEKTRDLVASGDIPIRVYNALMGPDGPAERLLAEGAQVGTEGSRFTARTIKVSFDGALGSGGAALLEPYSDREGNGFLKHTDEEMLPMLEAALREGIQVEVHAIGDRANRKILDLYEQAFAAVPPEERRIKDPRWRVEHAQILHPDDIERFAKLGVIPSMQPSHAITDLHFAPARLGMERLEGAYAWRTLIESGCIIPGGSDAPVERGDPLVEFYAAVTRQDLKGFQGDGWNPQQCVSREEALKMFTIWAAQAAFEESWRGTLQVGKVCDLTILTRDIMTIPSSEIPKVQVVMTVVGGDVIYERE